MSLLKKLALGAIAGMLIGTPVGYLIEKSGEKLQERINREYKYQTEANFPPIAPLIASAMAGIFFYRAGIRHSEKENRKRAVEIIFD